MTRDEELAKLVEEVWYKYKDNPAELFTQALKAFEQRELEIERREATLQ